MKKSGLFEKIEINMQMASTGLGNFQNRPGQFAESIFENGSKALILLYHNIRMPSFRERHKGMFVTTCMFKFQMWYLKSAGYRVVPLDTIYDYALQENNSREKLVALTFDDGYDDFYENAYPVLKSYNFPATVFLISGHIGGINNWRNNESLPKKLLTLDQIREMQKNGISFGSHTDNHLPLDSLASHDIFSELDGSRKKLENQLDREISFFAYPYGAHDAATHREVIRAGYKGAVTSDRGAVNQGDNLHQLKRLTIGFNNLPMRFVSKLATAL